MVLIMFLEYVEDPDVDEADEEELVTNSGFESSTTPVSTTQSSSTSSSTTTKASLTLQRVCPDSSWTLFDRRTYGWCVLVLATEVTIGDYPNWPKILILLPRGAPRTWKTICCGIVSNHVDNREDLAESGSNQQSPSMSNL
ncbi:unnamed protein product [Caenorhabditis angaria]|uniref:Uncharacterized protein n=1 Tax=Caenorhabditis angaria TaxID=860376 RepID=A0A9P1IQX0_9PELO|nr:unnamed protein product [Caenorhabditis angaria]